MILHVMNTCHMSYVTVTQSHDAKKILKGSKIIMLYDIVIIC